MVKIVIWEKPSQPFLKLNPDSCAHNKPGKIGGGGILRDHQSNMIYAFSIPLGFGSNNLADISRQHYTHHQLPTLTKTSYMLEKMRASNFRRKKMKRIKHSL